MELLINLVKEKDFLYNPQYSKQYNTEQLVVMRDEAWQEIAKKMGTTKGDCKSLWWSLRNDLKTAVKNKSISWKGVSLPFITSDFSPKYEKQMEFLLPYIEKSTGMQVLPKGKYKHSISTNISWKGRKRMSDISPEDVIDLSSENVHNGTIDAIEKESDTSESRTSVSKISCKKRKLMSDLSPANITDTIHEDRQGETLDDEYGELIIELDNEVISIPAKPCEADETDDEDSCVIRVKVKPTGDIDDHSSSTIPIDLDLDIDGDECVDIEVPLEEILGDIKVEDELDLFIDPLKRFSNNQLNLVVKEKVTIPEKVCRCKSDQDDEENEESYYSALAMSANQIDSYKVRLQLRKKITSLVMETVKKYTLSKTKLQ